MCGIAGYLNLDNKTIRDSDTILRMLSVQKHRGPDDSGIRAFSLNHSVSIEIPNGYPVIIDDKFTGILGFNRLSILDLSKNGHQPMISPDGKVLLTLNGEIYNAFDYKPELSQWGFNFKSTSDTEVVLALYLKYGIDGLLDRLNGMFAIAIVDLGLKTIYLARDRFGIKPMYYIKTNSTFSFASELKSFSFLDNFCYKLNEEKLDEYLIFRNNLFDTLYKDIKSLIPGHYLVFTPGNGLECKKYFDIENYQRLATGSKDIAKYGKIIEDCISKSVHRQLISDVKLGCQLSGGIDSSLVTWLANRNSKNGNFESVSIIFDNPKFNEEEYINRVTEKLGILSHKFILDSAYYYENIEKVTWHLEAPINHPNTVGIYKLSQRAKEYVTVLLSGEGADEVFGGYQRFYSIGYPFQFRRLLKEFRKNIRHPLEMFNYLLPVNRAIMATAFMEPAIAKKLKHDFNLGRAVKDRIALYYSQSGSYFDRQVKYELITYLPDLLIRQDKMSMAHSIENRVPFLDNEVVKNSFFIPERYLLLSKSPEGSNTEKYLLKKITASKFGNDFAFRRKMGFGIPVKEFFIDKKFSEYLNDKILQSIKAEGLFNHKLVAGWLKNISLLKYQEIEALWTVIAFEIWRNVYLDNNHENWNTRYQRTVQ